MEQLRNNALIAMILRYLFLYLFVLIFSESAIGSPEITVSINPERASYLYGEPIILTLIVTNTSSIEKSVTLGHNAEEDIILASDSKLYRYNGKTKSGLSKGSVLRLTPGRVYHELLLLNSWTGVVAEGKHVFKVTASNDPNLSASFSIEIKPSDPKLLKDRIIESILNLEGTKNASDANVIKESLQIINSTQSKTFIDSVLSSLDPASTEIYKQAIVPMDSYD